MPPFAITPLTRQNWDAKTPKPHPEVALIRAHLDILRESGLLGRDLLAAMVVRRILPLQRWPHLMFQTLQGSLPQPAPDVEASGASEMEDEDTMEPRSDSFTGTGDPLESEGTEPSGEYPRHALVDWTDDDEEASFCPDAAFEGDSDEVEEVTGPPPLRGRRQGGGATAADEAAGRKGKGATTSWPASKRPAPGPPAGQRADGAKRRRGGGRKQVLVVVGEAEDADEDTASAAERASWAAADAANTELEIESKRRWDTTPGKVAVDQPCPSRVERPAEKHAKARQDPSAHARVEEPASEAASGPTPGTEGTQPSEPAAPERVDLETIPVSPRAEAAPDAPVLDLTAPNATLDAPGATMDAPDAAHLPPVEEVASAGATPEPAVEPALGVGAIVVPQQGPIMPRAGGQPGSRPMKSWRAANAARVRMPAGTVLSGVAELVTLFDTGRSKVEQAARVVCGEMEHLEACTQAYNELRDEHLGADSWITELEVRLGEAAAECDALREAGGRLLEWLDLLHAKKKELEAAGRVELERLQAVLQEREASYTSDMDRLASRHLEEANLKDAALKAKDEALTQKQTQLGKALESAATLQEEIAHITHESEVREREVLEVFHETDGAFQHPFSETQVAANTAVEVCREERRAVGQEVDTTSGSSVKEIGVGLRARVHVLSESVTQLQVARSSMVAALWPEGMEPTTMSRLARWLAAGGEHLDAWRASATWSGAYMALRLATSWYRNLNLGKLAAQRDGSVLWNVAWETKIFLRARRPIMVMSIYERGCVIYVPL
ncbi:hypothetical protein ZWY2020_003234 [Hordeum vulgare]|nr:hypothetical protein ZWY2020_003234 [Hordeum vulgare]